MPEVNSRFLLGALLTLTLIHSLIHSLSLLSCFLLGALRRHQCWGSPVVADLT